MKKLIDYKTKILFKKGKFIKIKIPIYEDTGRGSATGHYPKPKMAE